MQSGFRERREECYMFNSMFSDNFREELRESDKHEIITKIADLLGPCPSNLDMAERIFDLIRFDITEYTLHHEYCQQHGIRSKLLCWLENKRNPSRGIRLKKVIEQYLK